MTKPAHYEACGIEPDEYCKANFTPEELRGAYMFNILKYLARYRNKDGIEDLHKAMDYLDWLIELESSAVTRSGIRCNALLGARTTGERDEHLHLRG